MQQLQENKTIREEAINNIKNGLAHEFIPQAYLKKSTTWADFEKIIVPMFLNALDYTIKFKRYQPSQRHYEQPMAYFNARHGVLECLCLFYDEPDENDEGSIMGYLVHALNEIYQQLPEEAK